MSKEVRLNKKRAVRTFYRYSESFKEQVIQEVSSGSSISAVCRKYDIKGADTVQKWIEKYGRTELLNTVIRVKMRSEDDKIKRLELEVKRLKIALADAVLAKDVLETLVAIVDEEYQTDVKKNLGRGLFLDVLSQKSKR
jgi:transposase-like protein